jgi:hypothetical protein
MCWVQACFNRFVRSPHKNSHPTISKDDFIGPFVDAVSALKTRLASHRDFGSQLEKLLSEFQSAISNPGNLTLSDCADILRKLDLVGVNPGDLAFPTSAANDESRDAVVFSQPEVDDDDPLSISKWGPVFAIVIGLLISQFFTYQI